MPNCLSCKVKVVCRTAREQTTEHFRWTFHNLFAHPLSEVVHLVGLRHLSNWIHDKSVPVHIPEQGRG